MFCHVVHRLLSLAPYAWGTVRSMPWQLTNKPQQWGNPESSCPEASKPQNSPPQNHNSPSSPGHKTLFSQQLLDATPRRCQRSLDAQVDSLAERILSCPAIAQSPPDPSTKAPLTRISWRLPCLFPTRYFSKSPPIRAFMHLGQCLCCARTAETGLSCVPPPAGQSVL
jgi:hypothetical protein